MKFAAGSAAYFFTAPPSTPESIQKSELISDTANISLLNEKLCEYYRSPEHNAMHYLLLDSSESSLQASYINLTLITREELRGHEDEFVQEKQPQPIDKPSTNDTASNSSYEPLYRQERPIALSQLWQEDVYQNQGQSDKSLSKRQSPQQIVIQGPAGVGKTTTLKYLATLWANPLCSTTSLSEAPEAAVDLTDWHQRFSAVVYLPLVEVTRYELDKGERNDVASVTKWLKSIPLYHTLPSAIFSGLAEIMVNSTETNLLARKPALLLLDGFDEVSYLAEEFIATQEDTEELQQNKRYQHQARQWLLRQLFACPYWISSTRPHLADHRCFNQKYHLALTGLTRDNVEEYIERFFKAFNQPGHVEPVKQWLSKSELADLARIPLQLELLCTVASGQKVDQLSQEELSLTGLYSKMLIHLCRRYLLKPPHSQPQELISTFSEEEILKEASLPLSFLSDIALQSMLQKTQQFSVNKLIQDCKSVKDQRLDENLKTIRTEEREEFYRCLFTTFGFLYPLGITHKNVLEQTYYFQHLTYQEFLAAYALVQQLLTLECKKNFHKIKELLFKENHKKIKQKLQQVQGPYYYRMQLFMAGLLGADRQVQAFCPPQITMAQREAVLEKLLLSHWRTAGKPGAKLLLGEWPMIGYDVKLIARNDFIQALRLIDASILADSQLGMSSLLLNQLAAIIKKYPEGHSYDYENEEVSRYFFSTRLLEYPRIRTVWLAKYKTYPFESIRLIEHIRCVLPGYLETVLQDALRNLSAVEMQQVAIETIGWLGPYASNSLKAELLRLTGTGTPEVQSVAAEAIGRLGANANSELQLALVRLLETGTPKVQSAAAQAIGWLGANANSELQLALVRLLETGTPEVQSAAAQAIGWLGANASSELKAKLLRLTRANPPAVQSVAANAIGRLGANANSELQLALVRLLETGTPAVQSATAQAIGRLGANANSELQLALVRLLETGTPEVQSAALDAITYTGIGSSNLSNELQLAIINLFQDKIWSIRHSALAKSKMFIDLWDKARLTLSLDAQTALIGFLNNKNDLLAYYTAARFVDVMGILLRPELQQAAQEPIDRIKRYEGLRAQANKEWEKAHIDTAETCYLEALELIPDEIYPDKSRGIYHNLGCYYHVQSQLEEAERCFQLALRLLPASNAHCDYGLLLLSRGKWPEAYEQFKLAKERNDSSGLSYSSLEKAGLDKLLQKEFAYVPSGQNYFSISARLMCRYQLVYCHCLLGNIEQQQEALQELINYSETCSDDEKAQAQRSIGYAKQHIQEFVNKNESAPAIEIEQAINTAGLSIDRPPSPSFFQPVNHHPTPQGRVTESGPSAGCLIKSQK